MVNWAEIRRYQSPGNYGFSEWPQPEDIDAMEQNGVIELMSIPEAADPSKPFYRVRSQSPLQSVSQTK
ncbi:MAG: hypothetical protein U0892_12940 [Pirellulales bacterium]